MLIKKQDLCKIKQIKEDKKDNSNKGIKDSEQTREVKMLLEN